MTNDMKKLFIKLLTTDSNDVFQECVEKLSDEFAEIFDYEGCVSKAQKTYEKQLADNNEELLFVSSLSNSNLPAYLSDIWKKAMLKTSKL